MVKTADEMLKLVDEFLSEAEPEQARFLWDVLTALRGGDTQKLQNRKWETTATIRTRAFPRVEQNLNNLPALFALPQEPTVVPDISDRSKDSSHFDYHISAADHALRVMGR